MDKDYLKNIANRKHLTTQDELIEKIEKGFEEEARNRPGIIDVLTVMKDIPECNGSDAEALNYIQRVIYAMKYKKRKAWPNKELRSTVNKLDKSQKDLFYQILLDIEEGLLEAGYGE